MAKGTFNQVVLVGRLGNDPAVRYLPSGSPVADFTMATDDGYKKNGEFQSEVNWHRITVFGKLAEIVKEYCHKGMLIMVVGRIQYQEWEGQDGQRKFGTKIIVNDLTMLSKKDEDLSRNPAEHDDVPVEDDDSVPF